LHFISANHLFILFQVIFFLWF